MGDKREDHDCVQRLEWSFFITTINKFYVHKKGQTICTIFFLLQCFHKKRKTWGLSTTVLAHPMSFDVFLSCLVQRSEHHFYWCLRRDARCSSDINPNAQIFTFHLNVGKKMMKIYSLQGYDEVPRRQLGASIFSVALSRMCVMYSTSFYTLIWEVFTFLKATIGSLSLC